MSAATQRVEGKDHVDSWWEEFCPKWKWREGLYAENSMGYEPPHYAPHNFSGSFTWILWKLLAPHFEDRTTYFKKVVNHCVKKQKASSDQYTLGRFFLLCRIMWLPHIHTGFTWFGIMLMEKYHLKTDYNLHEIYRDRLKSMQILLSKTQSGPGRTGKQGQEQTSRNHVQTL